MSIDSRHTYGGRPGMCWDGRESYILCDGCGLEYKITGDFDTVHEAAKADGWSTVKEDGEWANYCPDCQGGE